VIFFAYGTLLDAEYQRELFGRSVPTAPATLRDWQAVFTESGFLTIVPQPGADVRGALVTVDERELAICDAWEEVPLYERTAVHVIRDDATDIATWAYVRIVDAGDPAPPGVLARHARTHVIHTIRRFVTEGGGHTGERLRADEEA
jgi:gamma-glutamylcyclotransferase (GGCT)/AIG2-like uncharacterized protein YtfP